MADKRDILINLLGRETVSPAAAKAGDAVAELGDQMDDTAGDAARLDREIEQAEASLKDLAVQYARTGDAAGRVDLSKAIRRQQAELRKLTKVKGLLGDAAEAGAQLGAAVAGGMGGTMSKGLSGVFQSMPPQVQGAVVAAGAAIGVTMSAAIGAAITAGILLAVGGGVLAAGIKAAADSPKVKAAWSGFGDRAKAAFKDFGTPFEGPMVRAADTFADALERMAPTLKRMGESMAPVIDKLAPALADMAEKSLPGIEKAMEAGKPLWDTLAEHAPDIGEAISKFFDSIAEGGPGANKFLEDMLNIIEGTIITLGKVIGFLAKLYGKAREVWSGITAVFVQGVRVILAVLGKIIHGAAEAFGWIPGIGPKLKNAASKFKEFQQKANAELDKIKDEHVNVLIHVKAIWSAGAKGAAAAAGILAGERAAGGPVKAGQPYLVGEEGPELITPTADGFVHDARKTAQLLAGRPGATAAVGGGGGGTQVVVPPIQINAAGASGLERMFVAWLVKAIRDGGGNPSVLGLGGNW